MERAQDLRVLIDFGAKVDQAVAHGQVWRLFTAMFLHIGVIHLLFNMYALYILGPLVEGYFGHVRFLVIYLLGGLFGSLASYAFSPAISAGASGAIFALAGAIPVYFLRYRENFGVRGSALLKNIIFVIALNLVFDFMSMAGIDTWGHIGGLLGGAAISAGLLPIYKAPSVIVPGAQQLDEEPRAAIQSGWVLVCICLFVLGLQFATRALLGS